jgi:3-oxoacyl-[acyl-carrier-protein] synthase II
MTMRRVVVTGLGVVAPNGVGKEAFWSACLNGQSGIRPIQSFDASNHPVKIAGEIVGYDIDQFLPEAHRKSLKVMGRASRFAVGAAGLAIRDSGLDWEKEDHERIGVVMGAGLIPVETSELAPMLQAACDGDGQYDPKKLNNGGNSGLFPLWLLKHLPNMAAAHVSLVFNAQGPNNTVTTACVAGTQAVGEAFRLIERGDADVMLSGGADSRIEPLLLLAYSALGTLSRGDRPPEEVSRPYDRLRDGFVMGEGAAVLILEELERAKARGAEIYAEVLGFGSSFDAYSLTKPDPEAKGAARAIREALREAKIDHREVDYINAHGTSTRLNDQMETVAIKRVFGEGASLVPLSSIKSMIGHLIGAAGAVEAAALAMTLKHNAVPPTINLTHPDPSCDLDYVPQTAREFPIKTAVSTSFGFGGQNGALVMRQFCR